MAKRIITISREFGSGGRFIGEKVAKNLELLTMIKISLVRLQKSLVYHQNIFRKAQSYRIKNGEKPAITRCA